jgi:hypothetical protein
MTAFDLLLNYVVHADCHLKARDYGLLLSSLVVDRQSRAFLSDALLRTKKAWRKQKGYQKYLDLERSSLGERLSLDLGRGLLGATEMGVLTREAMAACTDASEYIWRFSAMPRQTTAFLHGDFMIIVRWMTAWATLQNALRSGANEHFVRFVRKEFGRARGVLQVKAFHTSWTHEDTTPVALELARGFAQDLIARAHRYEARFTSI